MKQRLLFFTITLAIVMPLKLWAQEPYAVLSDNNTVLTFYYDNQKGARHGMRVGPFNYSNQSWYSQAGSITTAVFDVSFANCTSITSTAFWFDECSKLTTITGIDNLKTDNVTNMAYMFYGCSGLTSLDLSNFKTDNVTNMAYMFYGCSGLTSLDVSNFKTGNVTNMSDMFDGCSGLTSLDVSNFKTDNVTNMVGMFWGCSGLTSLDLSGLNMANVTTMDYIFYDCEGLTNVKIPNSLTNIGYRAFQYLYLNGYKQPGITNTNYL